MNMFLFYFERKSTFNCRLFDLPLGLLYLVRFRYSYSLYLCMDTLTLAPRSDAQPHLNTLCNVDNTVKVRY